MTTQADILKWLQPNPVITRSPKEFLSATKELSKLADDFKSSLANHTNYSTYRASYFGGGGEMSSSYFDEISGEIHEQPTTSGAIGWGCHMRMSDLTKAGTVVSVWERGPHKLNDVIREYNYDLHFNKDLIFHKILTDSVVLLDPKEDRVIATAFSNWYRRPQKLGTMLFIATRQSVKDYSWAEHYVLSKRAGFSPSEAYFLAGLMWAQCFGHLHIRDMFSKESQDALFKDVAKRTRAYIISQDATVKNHYKMYPTHLPIGGAILETSPRTLTIDTGDGPMGAAPKDYVYPSFSAFSKQEFNLSYLARVNTACPQPSNQSFIMANTGGKGNSFSNSAHLARWVPLYAEAILLAAEGEYKKAEEYTKKARDILSEKDYPFNT